MSRVSKCLIGNRLVEGLLFKEIKNFRRIKEKYIWIYKTLQRRKITKKLENKSSLENRKFKEKLINTKILS